MESPSFFYCESSSGVILFKYILNAYICRYLGRVPEFPCVLLSILGKKEGNNISIYLFTRAACFFSAYIKRMGIYIKFAIEQ